MSAGRESLVTLRDRIEATQPALAKLHEGQTTGASLTPAECVAVLDLAEGGPGTPGGRIRALWDWLHSTQEHERALEELCPGYSIVSSKITSEGALMVAFDRLLEERRGN